MSLSSVIFSCVPLPGLLMSSLLPALCRIGPVQRFLRCSIFLHQDTFGPAAVFWELWCVGRLWSVFYVFFSGSVCFLSAVYCTCFDAGVCVLVIRSEVYRSYFGVSACVYVLHADMCFVYPVHVP